MSGHSPLDYGIDGPLGDHAGLPLDLKIMPEYFKDMGYQTALVGKWHLGLVHTDYWPISRGFDYHYGFLGGWVDFYTHVYTDSLDWQRNGESVREEGHSTDLLTADAVRVIQDRDPNKPIFLYLNYNSPHTPLQIIPEETGLNDSIEPGDRFVFAEMTTHADAGIGQVMDTLEAEGMLENTLVVFSSDNGGNATAGSSNGDLQFGKGSAYEGGIRVPGLISWPGKIEAGTVLEQPMAVYDWLPTLLSAVGGNPDDVVDPYGQNMWSAITEDEVVEPSLKVIGTWASKAAFDWPWKFVRQANGANPGDFLFNVVDDPLETNELSAQFPEKAAELAAVLDALPEVESKRNPPGSVRPETMFRNEDDTGWNYDVRILETDEPYAEKALR